VFALEDIPDGHQVIEYTGRRLSEDQAAVLGAPHENYVVCPSQGVFINGSVGGSGAQFINHACNPNLTWVYTKGRLFYYSRKPIRAHEELTMYYNHPIRVRKIGCRCGSRKCSKILRYLIE
jgi:SET domain-containing protein